MSRPKYFATPYSARMCAWSNSSHAMPSAIASHAIAMSVATVRPQMSQWIGWYGWKISNSGVRSGRWCDSAL